MTKMKPKPVTIKDVVDEVIKKLEEGKVSEAESLTSSWAKAIGKENVRHAKPVEVKNRTLIIHVDSSSWLHKLSMEKTHLLTLLKNDLGGDIVDDIKLRIGAL